MMLLLSLCSIALADDFASLRADRAAMERVYYSHRLGEKPPFEQVLPPATLENLVRQDLRKEAALKQAYGVEVTPAMLDAEIQRINTTTRAPEMLAEIKTALGNDPARFANGFAKPILVERLLREKFDNDDALHAPRRCEMELVRTRLANAAAVIRSTRPHGVAAAAQAGGNEALTEKSEIRNPKSEIGHSLLTNEVGTGRPHFERGRLNSIQGRTVPTLSAGLMPPLLEAQILLKPAAANDLVEKLVALLKCTHSNAVTETTWQLGTRPAETNVPTADDVEIRKRFGPNARILSSPPCAGDERKFYFEELPQELRKVLGVQLRQPGDVSAVMEMPGGFLLYVVKEKTDAVLRVAGLSLPKRGYEQWLNEQNPGAK